MRVLAANALAALNGRTIPIVMLIEMQLDETVYLSSAGVDFEYDGITWMGAAKVGEVSAVRDSAGERQALTFTLSSVPYDLLAISVGQKVRGKRVKIYEAILDPDTYAVIDAPLVWSGRLDQMSISEGVNDGSISVTAEHAGTAFARTKPLRYTDGDQERLFPGDKSMQFVVSQANHKDVWPAAAYFKQ